MGIPVVDWNSGRAGNLLQNSGLLIDGIAGTGLRGALAGNSAEMAAALNDRRLHGAEKVFAIDMPSGCSASWKTGDPVVNADVTLAIEPLKRTLYTPALRRYCGSIIPVEGIFPSAFMERYRETAELLDWDAASSRIPPVSPWAYKYERGLAEIHAGDTGTAGAARIAAAGAQAAGAGLVRLLTNVYPVLAAGLGGIMAAPETGKAGGDARFSADSLLLGPGWGRGADRLPVLESALEAEKGGLPLILDADGIALAGDAVFHGRAILTPHAGEMASYTGISKERLLAEPDLIVQTAVKKNAVILFKSHVMVIAAPDGRLAFIDGLEPLLSAGGSGDRLAGFCAAISARMYALERRGQAVYDPHAAAAAAAALLIAAAQRVGRAFADPLELAAAAAAAAGEAWLPLHGTFRG
jgi:NAD(P)H-hydrate epimerase